MKLSPFRWNRNFAGLLAACSGLAGGVSERPLCSASCRGLRLLLLRAQLQESAVSLDKRHFFFFPCPLCLSEMLHSHEQGFVFCFSRGKVENQLHYGGFCHFYPPPPSGMEGCLPPVSAVHRAAGGSCALPAAGRAGPGPEAPVRPHLSRVGISASICQL